MAISQGHLVTFGLQCDTLDGNICLLYTELAFLKYLEGVYGNAVSDYDLKLSQITNGEIPLRSTCFDNVK